MVRGKRGREGENREERRAYMHERSGAEIVSPFMLVSPRVGCVYSLVFLVKACPPGKERKKGSEVIVLGMRVSYIVCIVYAMPVQADVVLRR